MSDNKKTSVRNIQTPTQFPDQNMRIRQNINMNSRQNDRIEGEEKPRKKFKMGRRMLKIGGGILGGGSLFGMWHAYSSTIPKAFFLISDFLK